MNLKTKLVPVTMAALLGLSSLGIAYAATPAQYQQKMDSLLQKSPAPVVQQAPVTPKAPIMPNNTIGETQPRANNANGAIHQEMTQIMTNSQVESTVQPNDNTKNQQSNIVPHQPMQNYLNHTTPAEPTNPGNVTPAPNPQSNWQTHQMMNFNSQPGYQGRQFGMMQGGNHYGMQSGYHYGPMHW